MSPEQIRQFLIIHNAASGDADVVEYGTDEEAALAAYAEAEQKHRDDSNIEVVLIGSDSLETVKRTHSSYFSDTDPFGSLLVTRR